MPQKLMRIGEVSERTGLSPRTIRHYEDVGVLTPVRRSLGGSRLYTETEVRRLTLVRQMRPLGFCLEDVRALLQVLEQLPESGGGGRTPPPDDLTPDALATALREYWVEADARCDNLRRELAAAEDFARSLHRRLAEVLDAGAATPPKDTAAAGTQEASTP